MNHKLDYKKEYKDLYLPKTNPMVIKVPPIQYIAIEGTGNPNEEEGEYGQAVGLLYALTYTIKMSKMGISKPEGYFDYVVPPLEGFWWMADGRSGVDYTRKDQFNWISVIRQPEFVTEDVFFWACSEVERKKHLDTEKAKIKVIEEGLCVQCMHQGSFNEEPATVKKMENYIVQNGYVNDISEKRRHHEIYLGDPRKCKVENMKTVIRHPIK